MILHYWRALNYYIGMEVINHGMLMPCFHNTGENIIYQSKTPLLNCMMEMHMYEQENVISSSLS